MNALASSRPRMPLSDLLGARAAAWTDVQVTGVQLDSRRVGPGDLFLALPGASHDGRQFIEQAVAQGAVAVVAEPPVAGFVDALHVPLLEQAELAQAAGEIAARLYGDPSAAMITVGVTGTNGKTTTSRLLAQLLRAAGYRCGVIGTLGAVLDDSATEARNTTPDAIALQQQLAAWRDEGVDAVCMEVSSHALDQGRVQGMQFDVAVFTNLSHDHLDYHGNMAAYARSKQQLFSQRGLRFAVVNADDPYSVQMRAGLPADVESLTFSSRGEPADVRVVEAEFFPGGARAQLQTPWGEATLSLPLPGDFNLSNALAALSCAVLLGGDLPSVLAAVARLQPVPGRMQSVANTLGVQVVVDYAHTPDALEKALQALRPQVAGRLLVVFGCGGDRDPAKRAVMGRVACAAADAVILTSDNPRSEDPQAILDDIQRGCQGVALVEADRAAAINLAIDQAQPGDCVLIAGKGHETYQIIGDQRCAFSDVDCAARALQRRAAS
ncbi:MAG: UDP-N-acetylmuramoyl-L-alanyl-D-glutamate--2,6-diaminopimelate ligase [Halieaceae bacterium]|uniref:UDP-N-acetylmuramoyl-L-alanyl-D-glutamate--2, 6-diaminopimelate ligase n=1 Tax=Haliea alexandrii TaxID=2448162 RepID=UPI0018EE5AE0|nr:UDP-N-acetylmuramoyl-L-alanyl-D-glutamate--2,6-diaminopimelate ligase [Haliea alexandrii]MCR9186386.1 UDP-N-acetylmuramoyl-L-alanyl-D-glutamate--2,6-diaminopimelate ligase [Halieaceae bacterium]